MKRTIVALILVQIVIGVGCSDHTVVSPDLILPTDFVISNPALSGASTSAVRGRASISSTAERIVYVSLPPRTFPNAAVVWIQNQTRDSAVLNVQVIHGGFDPVPIEASDGDELKLTIFDPGSATITKTVKVPVKRPPTIVRSDPGKGRTDIALNVSVTVVFDEPIDAKTVNATSVHLTKEGDPVSGTVVFVDNLWTVKFVPTKPLDPQSSYELAVTPGVRDLGGNVLEGSYRANFTTGTTQDSPCPGYADPADCPPFQTGGSGVITGVISERTADGIKPLAGATVNGWVELQGRGYARGATTADSAGRFIVTTLPQATIMLQGYAAGHDQPCAAVLEFNGASALMNVELVSTARPLLDVANKPPIIKGIVYEMTATGKQPVPGALVQIDLLNGLGLVAATTTTDEDGRYAVCQIPDFGNGQAVIAAKTGYQDSFQQVSVGGTTELQLDIELKH